MAILSLVLFLGGSLYMQAQRRMMQEEESEETEQYMMPGRMMGMMNRMMSPMYGNMMDMMGPGYGNMMGMMYPMYGHMMGMNNMRMPMMRVMGVVSMLPGMEDELSLSEDQVNQLIDLQAGFQKQLIDYQADLAKKRTGLNKLISQDASVDQVREQMQACAGVRTSMRVAAYETAMQMKSELDQTQQDQLEDMMREQHQEMMQNYRGRMRRMMDYQQ